eukprot:scaffold1342_cov120-Isochrysis_galbana.AAC.7
MANGACQNALYTYRALLHAQPQKQDTAAQSCRPVAQAYDSENCSRRSQRDGTATADTLRPVARTSEQQPGRRQLG